MRQPLIIDPPRHRGIVTVNIKTCLFLCLSLASTFKGVALAQATSTVDQSIVNSPCSVQVSNSPNAYITADCRNSDRAATIDNQPVLLVRGISDFQHTMSNFMNQNNQIGLVQPGTRVEIIGEVEAGSSVFEKLAKIRILEGGLAGQVGWIYSSRIQFRDVSS